jgi:hypothetical protein
MRGRYLGRNAPPGKQPASTTRTRLSRSLALPHLITREIDIIRQEWQLRVIARANDNELDVQAGTWSVDRERLGTITTTRAGVSVTGGMLAGS